MTYKRLVNQRAGFDCRSGNCPSCKAGDKADHGIAGDRWFFTIVMPDAALTLAVSTPNYPATVLARGMPDTLSRYYYDIDLCLAWPSDVGSIASGSTPVDCEYIGKCYAGNGLSSTAERAFADKHLDHTKALEQPDSFWDALAQLLRSMMDHAAPYRAMTQCRCCAGTGVFDPEKASR